MFIIFQGYQFLPSRKLLHLGKIYQNNCFLITCLLSPSVWKQSLKYSKVFMQIFNTYRYLPATEIRNKLKSNLKPASIHNEKKIAKDKIEDLSKNGNRRHSTHRQCKKVLKHMKKILVHIKTKNRWESKWNKN